MFRLCLCEGLHDLKTASARRTRNRFAEHLAAFYKKPLFWHRAYFVGSVGGATLETVRAYVDAQGTEEHARKAAVKAKAKPKFGRKRASEPIEMGRSLPDDAMGYGLSVLEKVRATKPFKDADQHKALPPPKNY